MLKTHERQAAAAIVGRIADEVKRLWDLYDSDQRYNDEQPPGFPLGKSLDELWHDLHAWRVRWLNGPRLTLEQFVATRRFEPDVSKADSTVYDDVPYAQPALVYDETLMIGLVTRDWPKQARSEGKYHLLLSNQEWISDDLGKLERLLYEDHYLAC